MAKGSSIPETKDHISKVQECAKTLCIEIKKRAPIQSNNEVYLGYINQFCDLLIQRAEKHDASKMEDPEVEYFDEYTPKLKTSVYGSEEYNGFLAGMKPALDHHYGTNRHHPESHKGGISDMNLIDLCELLCDWKAATLRHETGNLTKSIQGNQKRFRISEPLTQILLNSVKIFEPEKESLGIDIITLIITYCCILTDNVDDLDNMNYKVVEEMPSVDAPQLTQIIRNSFSLVKDNKIERWEKK